MIIEFCVIIRFIAMTHICITLFKFLVFVAPFCVNGVYYKNGTTRVQHINYCYETYSTANEPYGANNAVEIPYKNVSFK